MIRLTVFKVKVWAAPPCLLHVSAVFINLSTFPQLLCVDRTTAMFKEI